MPTEPVFALDVRNLVRRAKHELRRRAGGTTVSINLPFISVSVTPDDVEKRVAREIVVRLVDRRVLSAQECCDNCIDQALASIQEIRTILVDEQVELLRLPDGPLYLLIEFMLEGIRQFLTFEQRLRERVSPQEHGGYSDFQRAPEQRSAYFDALEMLRAHLNRCLLQTGHLADFELPNPARVAQYGETWPLERYNQPEFPETIQLVHRC